MRLTPERLANIPHAPGVYTFTRRGTRIYIGKAADLRSRLAAYAPNHDWKTDMLREATSLRVTRTNSEVEAILLEAAFIRQHQPKYNVLSRDDKTFLYVRITTEEEFPQVLPTRTMTSSGTYFGPYTSALVVKRLLRALRKAFPYRCNQQPIAPGERGKPCLYFHMGLCAGTCAGQITAAQYRRRVTIPLLRLLGGKSQAARRALDPIHRTLLDQVLAQTQPLSTIEQFAVGVRELQRILRLPNPPRRIEGYDISNLHGREAVGSMVVTIDGEAVPSEYKRFKIKTLEGQSNDVAMLREVLGRRLAHLATPSLAREEGESMHRARDVWPMPDLLLIDGGKGQLNAAVRELRRAGATIPVVSLAKREEEVYLPGARAPLRLLRSSPALQLLQRVRDEAHRFAIGYHRLRRAKRFLGQ